MNRNVYQKLPDISELQNISFSQSSIITDRNGKELYRLFEENREYVPYENINENMIKAIVAIEDQRYWEHNGLDTIGIFRAAIYNVFNPGKKLQGASTIPQQFIKNLLLSSDQKIERKLKEIILTKRLDKIVTDKVSKGRNLSSEEVFQKKKEKILELYLNYIPFGNNSFGVEAASKTYFAKSAKDLDVLESAILWSIPKSATIYNPYNNKEKLMGRLNIKDINEEDHFDNPTIRKAVLERIKTIINNADFSDQNSPNSFIKYIEGLLNFSMTYEGITYNISYNYGRKDIGLGSMFEKEYITEKEVKKAFFDSLNFEFKKAGFDIKAPHFVMMIKKQLEKDFTTEQIQEWGLIIRTSLDYEIQQIAEDAIHSSKEKIVGHGGNNEAMLYFDSENGDILAYVGSMDYFDEGIQGQNDMIQAKRQVGSTLKPFVYAMGLENLPVSLETPMYDIPFKVWGFTPNNADNKFMGILPLKKALAYSRNIPAIKMFFSVGGETKFKPFLKSLGIESIKDTVDYGYSMVLGAAEISMLELGKAYSHLSSASPAEINGILDIKKKDGSIIYQKKNKKKKNPISLGARYLTWNILSNYSNMPPSWAGAFIVKNMTLGVKSWTSDVKTKKGNRPRDGWVVSYTPSKVALFRAGNTNGNPLYRSGYGGTMNGTAMRKFWNTLVSSNRVKTEWISQIEVKTENISSINGKSVGNATPTEFSVSSLGYSKSPTNTLDPGMTRIQYDKECNGMISPFTPTANIHEWYVITPTTFMPNTMDLEDIKRRWNWSTEKEELPAYLTWRVHFNYTNIFAETPKEPCGDIVVQNDPTIQITLSNLVDKQEISQNPQIVFSTTSTYPIRSLSFLVDDEVVSSYKYYGNETTIATAKNINLSKYPAGEHTFSIFVLNSENKTNQKSIKIHINENDTTPPSINTEKVIITSDPKRGYNVTLLLEDNLSGVEWGSVHYQGKLIHTFKNVIANFFIPDLWIIEVTAKDTYGNTMKETLDLTKYH